MDKDELIAKLVATFVGELEEHVAALNRELLALERRPDDDREARLGRLLRTVHTIKGAARAVNATAIEEATHRLEAMVVAAQEGRAEFGADEIEVFFAVADALADAGARLGARRPLEGSPLQALLPRLGALAKQAAAASSDREPHRAEREPSRAEREPTRAAPEPAQAAPEPAPTDADAEAWIRVPASALDECLAHDAELLVARRRLDGIERRLQEASERAREIAGRAGDSGAGEPARDLSRELERLAGDFSVERRAVGAAARALDRSVRAMRMVPLLTLEPGLRRALRDLARDAGKRADLAFDGGRAQVDRAVLQALRDPLLQLVRNAIDHGIEPPEERRAAGKPLEGRVAVTAAVRGDRVEIVVEDDGRGLDLEALRARAAERGLRIARGPGELLELVLAPGVSTAARVTEVSGRGVGLEIVRERLEAMHGALDVASRPGGGTRFTLSVPLLLTAMRALLCVAGGELLALPSAQVARLLRLRPDELRPAGGGQVVTLDGAPVAVVALADLLGFAAAPPRPPGGRLLAAVVAAGERRAALVVDEVVAELELVAQGLGPRLRRVRHVAGATLLPTGRLALILHPADLVAAALAGTARPLLAAAAPAEPRRRPRVLLVDDSLTTRALEKSILEGAGYEVVAAADGAEAWRLLQQQGADLLLADVEMPGMDGFALTEAVRASKRFPSLPVVLLTARETDADRERGLAAGADAYLVKSGFDQSNLLATLRQLL